MGWLATLALYLSMDEIGKLLNNRSGNAMRENLANKIITRAEEKGNEALTKAMNAINNIPAIASSPAVQSKLREARRKAVNNYTRVEKAVTNLRGDAQQMANELNRINDQPVIDKIMHKRENNDRVNAIEEQFEQKMSSDLLNNEDQNK